MQHVYIYFMRLIAYTRTFKNIKSRRKDSIYKRLSIARWQWNKCIIPPHILFHSFQLLLLQRHWHFSCCYRYGARYVINSCCCRHSECYARLQLTHVAMDTKCTSCDFVISSCKERWALLFEKSCHIYWTAVTVVHIGYHMNNRWTLKSIKIKSRYWHMSFEAVAACHWICIPRFSGYLNDPRTLTNSWCGRTSQ